jgi:selenophosphate synthase
MFRLETGQVRRRFEPLEIETLLPHQGMLVIGAVGEPAATVGDALLRDRDGAAAGMQLLVIRPLGTGVDPAFDAIDASAEAR